jgi:para-nitrobenzyl esterase
MIISNYKNAALLLMLLSLLHIPASKAQNSETKVPGDPVKIESGLVAGKLLPNGVKAYLAIPYAQPPVGEFRWREPQPVKPWEGIRTTDTYCAPCAQKGNNSSEDCLYLNVWAPTKPKSKKLPVVVYIHGGAYTGGWASPSGEVLAAKGTVFVNFNYRLGVFGNLVLPELTAESPHKASGNYAHLDQIAVLQWIHKNIQKFGGDPNKVTIMGQSSGSIDICFLQASPLTRGLIHRVVGLSGANFPGGPWVPRSQDELGKAGLEYQEKLKCKSLAEMRALPIDALLKETTKPIGEPGAADGYAWPESPLKIYAQKEQNKVPAILCTCRDESGSGFRNVKTVDEFKAKIRSLDSEYADEILKLLPVSSEEDVRNAITTIGYASGVVKQMVTWAETQSASQSPAYLSVFSHGERAGHGADIEYWIGNVTISGKTAADRELSDKMSDALVAFAKTGNPNTAATKWPAYTSGNPVRLTIDNEMTPVTIDPKAFQLLAHPEFILDNAWGNTRSVKK